MPPKRVPSLVIGSLAEVLMPSMMQHYFWQVFLPMPTASLVAVGLLLSLPTDLMVLSIMYI
uniref:Uncharacterized protein n=1 Tax=Lutzomyia longipalpis TaxID=7200 RepID=A0A1B0CST8_LUTLO